MVVVGYEAVAGSFKEIVTELSHDGIHWGPPLVVAQDTLATTDLANPNLYQLPNGRLLCAFRHHTNQPNKPTIYRIEVCYTDKMDHWSFLGTVDAYTTSAKTGIWEPFLFQVPNSNNLYCAYAKELSSGEQNIVARISTDGGTNWGSEFIISHTANSRDGMPTVTTLNDGSLLAVFEGWWAGTRGKFTVNSRRSFDQGRTWTQPQVIHQSPGSHNSGAPWATKILNGSLVVAFMTDEDWTGGLNWPAYASIKVLTGPSRSLRSRSCTQPVFQDACLDAHHFCHFDHGRSCGCHGRLHVHTVLHCHVYDHAHLDHHVDHDHPWACQHDDCCGPDYDHGDPYPSHDRYRTCDHDCGVYRPGDYHLDGDVDCPDHGHCPGDFHGDPPRYHHVHADFDGDGDCARHLHPASHRY